MKVIASVAIFAERNVFGVDINIAKRVKPVKMKNGIGFFKLLP